MDGEIGHEELESLLEDGDARVVDIRTPRAFARGHVPGSENVPFGRLVDEIERFDGDDRVVTVCPHGESSVQAARLVASYEGFEGRVESFGPGLAAWDGPVETGRDDAAGPTDGSPDGHAADDESADEGPAAPF